MGFCAPILLGPAPWFRDGAFSDWGEMFAVWRYLDYNFKSSAKIEDVHFSGPAFGVAFHW